MNISTKKILGWSVLILISLAPAVLWFFFGNGAAEFSKSFSHSLGELFGLIGMTMFALTFVLSTRIGFIEDIFGGGLIKYIFHMGF